MCSYSCHPYLFKFLLILEAFFIQSRIRLFYVSDFVYSRALIACKYSRSQGERKTKIYFLQKIMRFLENVLEFKLN